MRPACSSGLTAVSPFKHSQSETSPYFQLCYVAAWQCENLAEHLSQPRWSFCSVMGWWPVPPLTQWLLGWMPPEILIKMDGWKKEKSTTLMIHCVLNVWTPNNQIQMCLIVFQEHPWPRCYGRLVVRSGRKRRQLKPKLHREVQSAQQQVGCSLLHVHAPQQCGRSRTGTPELPATLLAHPLGLLHQPLTRGHRLAELSLCCYSPDWLWEKTQLLCLNGEDR